MSKNGDGRRDDDGDRSGGPARCFRSQAYLVSVADITQRYLSAVSFCEASCSPLHLP